MPTTHYETNANTPALNTIYGVVSRMLQFESEPARIRVSELFKNHLCDELNVTSDILFQHLTLCGAGFVLDTRLDTFEVDAI